MPPRTGTERNGGSRGGRRLSQRLRAVCVIAAASLALTSCNQFSSVPEYTELSTVGFNYTPYNLYRFTITDRHGNSITGGDDLMPGASDTGNNCCHTLKGTEFTVEYQLYDADTAMEQREEGKPVTTVIRTATVSLPSTDTYKLLGRNVLGVFFYPDNQVVFHFNRNLVDAPRIVYSAIYTALDQHYHDELNPEKENDATIFRDTAQYAAAGWSKYRLQREDDLEQYVYFAMIYNSLFDEHAVMRRLLQDSRGKPGYFAENSKNLPENLLTALKNDQFRHLPPQAPLTDKP